ncbi:MAG TPA: hypothetical protein VF857_07670, partial [Spirochaetota bacterium]
MIKSKGFFLKSHVQEFKGITKHTINRRPSRIPPFSPGIFIISEITETPTAIKKEMIAWPIVLNNPIFILNPAPFSHLFKNRA